MASSPKRNALPWLALSAVVIVLDQWSKAWVLSSLPEYQPVPVIDMSERSIATPLRV